MQVGMRLGDARVSVPCLPKSTTRHLGSRRKRTHVLSSAGIGTALIWAFSGFLFAGRKSLIKRNLACVFDVPCSRLCIALHQSFDV